MIDRDKDAAGGLVRDRLECDRGGRQRPVDSSRAMMRRPAPHIRWYIPTGGVMSRRAMPKRQIVWGVSKWVI